MQHLEALVHSGDDYPECRRKFSSDKHPFQVSLWLRRAPQGVAVSAEGIPRNFAPLADTPSRVRVESRTAVRFVARQEDTPMEVDMTAFQCLRPAAAPR
jgi:hypothetical protein